MIVGNQKPIKEIRASIASYRKVLVVGCGTCVAVCLTGGLKEAKAMVQTLSQEGHFDGDAPDLVVSSIERQCEPDFLEEFLVIPPGTDAILSLACGAGVQTLARVYADLPIIPGLNTTFLGALDRPGVWLEMCYGCGDCVLAQTGGICPVARCAKHIFNGPCGGSSRGLCEISQVVGRDVDCAWHLIIDRLKSLGKVENYHIFHASKDWSTDRSGGPRLLTRPESGPTPAPS